MFLDYVSAIVNRSSCTIKLPSWSAMICHVLKKYVSNLKKKKYFFELQKKVFLQIRILVLQMIAQLRHEADQLIH